MAYGVLSKPGTKYGPCDNDCQHVDCAETRRQATSSCRICGKAIGYDKPFNVDHYLGERVLVHHLCLVDEIERERDESLRRGK